MQLHYLFNVAHFMRLVVQREGGLDVLKVAMTFCSSKRRDIHPCHAIIRVSNRLYVSRGK